MLVALLLALTTIPDAHVDAALEAAGENRAELQKVLDHFAGDEKKRTAARFLIANMPGHGYIITRLETAKGETLPFDPTDYATLNEATARLDELEAKHGSIDFKRDKKIEDVKTMTADYLIRHIENSFKVWESTPESVRVDFDAFLNFVLPYRGSQEPVEDWLSPLMQRYAHAWKRLEKLGEARKVAGFVSKDLRRSVRFN